MNELNEIAGNSGSGPAIRPLGTAGHFAPNVNPTGRIKGIDRLDVTHSDGGYNFSGIDSLGGPVKGFVQTEEAALAANELERAGISVQSIKERRGPRKKNRRPTSIEFATLAEQFGDLMEVGESPTQICRLLSYAQTNKVLSDALLEAGELIINGRSLSEAFAAQRDHKGEPIFPITFICALRIGEEVGTASDAETG